MQPLRLTGEALAQEVEAQLARYRALADVFGLTKR